jgi:hypothetical protein
MTYERIVKSFQQMAEDAGQGSDYGDRVIETMTEDLRKALSLGTYPVTAGTAYSDAGPLRLQNLDSTMTSVLFSEQHIKLWNFLTKVPSSQPYYEWNRRRGYGSSRGSAGFAEGGAPKGGVSQFERNGVYNKYMGVRRGITHQLALTGQLGGTALDPVGEENRNGTMELMENIERNLMFGDSAILSEAGASVNYDGILKQMESGSLGTTANVVDLVGAPMSFGAFEDAAERLYTTGYVSNFADLHCFMTPAILADLSKLKYESGTFPTSSVVGQNTNRRLLGPTAEAVTTGMPLKGHETNFGFIGFDPWIFGERVKSDKPTDFTNAGTAGSNPDANAPVKPSVPTVAAAGTDAPNFTAGNVGTFYYSTSAFNDSGESNIAISATVTPTATQHVTVTLGAPPATATGFRIYRGKAADGSDAKWIKDVPASAATYVDKNTKIPGTGYVFLLNKNPETLVVSQMTPLIRYPLAIVSTTVEWLLLLYHVPVLKAGERIYIFKNVGRL